MVAGAPPAGEREHGYWPHAVTCGAALRSQITGEEPPYRRLALKPAADPLRKKKEDLLIVHENYDGCWPNGFGRGIVPMRFTIGLKCKGKVNHVVLDSRTRSSPP